MSVALIADAHLGGPGGAAGPLVAQLEALPGEGCRHLVLLGDLFQVWVGSRRFETPEVATTVGALRRLRAAGVRVDYVEGNRDFFLAGGPYADAFDRLGTETTFTAGGRRWLAVHGDGLDEGDRQYRLWRALSKSAPTRLLVRRLPRRLARRLVGSTERRLSGTNFKHKVRIPRPAIEGWATRRLAEGHDGIALGHFHEEHVWELPGGTVRLVEAWFSSRRVEWPERWEPAP